VLCGEEAAAAVQNAGVAGRMSHISSDARSFEDLLFGRPLAGVVALNDKV
jgi:3-phosphoglycerate kinase